MYIINKNTLYIFFDGVSTIIKEEFGEVEYYDNKIEQIIKESCNYYGSSLKGRIEGSKNILNSKYKLPIIISDINNLVIFSIKGSKKDEIIWFNYNKIRKYNILNDYIEVEFKNNTKQKFLVSRCIFANQMLKSSQLLLTNLIRNGVINN